MLRHVDHVDNESGIALAVAIYALVVVGALVGGAFFLGMQEQRVGRNSLHAQQAFMAAEGGAQEYMANWDTSATQLAVGDSLTFGGWLPDNVGWYRGSVLRINGPLFLIRSEGFSRDSLARQQVGALVRTVTMEMNVVGAIAAPAGLRKETPLGMSSGFDNCSGGDNVAGIQVPDGPWCRARKQPARTGWRSQQTASGSTSAGGEVSRSSVCRAARLPSSTRGIAMTGSASSARCRSTRALIPDSLESFVIGCSATS